MSDAVRNFARGYERELVSSHLNFNVELTPPEDKDWFPIAGFVSHTAAENFGKEHKEAAHAAGLLIRVRNVERDAVTWPMDLAFDDHIRKGGSTD